MEKHHEIGLECTIPKNTFPIRTQFLITARNAFHPEHVRKRPTVDILLHEIGTRMLGIEIFHGLVKPCHAIDVQRLERLCLAPEQIVFLPVLDRVDVENFDRHVFAIRKALRLVYPLPPRHSWRGGARVAGGGEVKKSCRYSWPEQ